ncbi:carboxymuconolactone decarboxylase family protein [Bacillus ectoiniformans]|uniref:carboxymuconolactone decarboxylase family protein n=1 Tax=Bacillus ectoiniformans TaxID=1494429 RepID=UPI0019582989|nr:carboxymuconolactone decarboxylase family protein [Bacillus ectoiniformans]
MEETRYEIGMKKFREYTANLPEAAVGQKMSDPLDSVAPEFRKWIIEFAYGDIYSRPHLDNKERTLIVIASLVTQGMTTQIATHIKRGLVAGLTKEQISECIIQLIPYTGFPKVQQALTTAKSVFDESNQ